MEYQPDILSFATAICTKLAAEKYMVLLEWIKQHQGTYWSGPLNNQPVELALGDTRPKIFPTRLKTMLAEARLLGIVCSTVDSPATPLLHGPRLKSSLTYLLQLLSPEEELQYGRLEKAYIAISPKGLQADDRKLLTAFSTDMKVRFLKSMLAVQSQEKPMGKIHEEALLFFGGEFIFSPIVKDQVAALGLVSEAGKKGNEKTYRLNTDRLGEALDLLRFIIFDLGLLDEPKP
jgi:hypothetical protein